jgi:hypothetical protein
MPIIEFGGSNGIIRKLTTHIADYEVAPNYPDVDLHDLLNTRVNTLTLL